MLAKDSIHPWAAEGIRSECQRAKADPSVETFALSDERISKKLEAGGSLSSKNSPESPVVGRNHVRNERRASEAKEFKET